MSEPLVDEDGFSSGNIWAYGVDSKAVRSKTVEEDGKDIGLVKIAHHDNDQERHERLKQELEDDLMEFQELEKREETENHTIYEIRKGDR